MNELFEVVKVVKGVRIVRMKGTTALRQYYVNIREPEGWKEFHVFSSIKKATEFIKNALCKN
mgnify:CR=1 FL=1